MNPGACRAKHARGEGGTVPSQHLSRALLWKIANSAAKPEEGHNVPSTITARVIVALQDLGK